MACKVSSDLWLTNRVSWEDVYHQLVASFVGSQHFGPVPTHSEKCASLLLEHFRFKFYSAFHPLLLSSFAHATSLYVRQVLARIALWTWERPQRKRSNSPDDHFMRHGTLPPRLSFSAVLYWEVPASEQFILDYLVISAYFGQLIYYFKLFL